MEIPGKFIYKCEKEIKNTIFLKKRSRLKRLLMSPKIFKGFYKIHKKINVALRFTWWTIKIK